MRVALICPSNLLFMPYLETYLDILKREKIEYDIVSWDRFHFFDNNISYKDKKNGHQRGLIDYFKYALFVKKILKKNKYEKIILFGIPLAFFLNNFLIKNYNGKFLFDIRDHHKLLKYFNVKKFVDSSKFTIISSSRYKEWLPNSDKYLINHNIKLNLNNLPTIGDDIFKEKHIKISYIGSLTNLEVNIQMIKEMPDSSKYILIFNGEGIINKTLRSYVNSNEISNVVITGKYEKSEERDLYKNADIVNLLLDSNDLNSKTCLANRLYNAAYFGRPLLVMKGSYISEIVERFKLGLVVNSMETILVETEKYISAFDINEYSLGRSEFFEWVKEENLIFEANLQNFIDYI